MPLLVKGKGALTIGDKVNVEIFVRDSSEGGGQVGRLEKKMC